MTPLFPFVTPAKSGVHVGLNLDAGLRRHDKAGEHG